MKKQFKDFVKTMETERELDATALVAVYMNYGLIAFVAALIKSGKNSAYSISGLMSRVLESMHESVILQALPYFASYALTFRVSKKNSVKVMKVLDECRRIGMRVELSFMYGEDSYGLLPISYIVSYSEGYDRKSYVSNAIKTIDELDKYIEYIDWSILMGRRLFSEKELLKHKEVIAKNSNCFSKHVKKMYSREFWFEIFMADPDE
jgi:hypothetical protein